jgi:uncharacterized protein (TIGR02246 family)
MTENRWILRGVWIALLVAAPSSLTLSAQVLPGQPRPQDRLQVQQAQFRALILERVNGVISEWQEAWNNDDSEGLARTYSEVGDLILTGDRVKGREGIEEYVREVLPTFGHLSFSLAEFEASGSMAMMLSTFFFREDVGPNDRTERVGDCLTVLVEEHGSWKIRSQVFRLAPPT